MVKVFLGAWALFLGMLLLMLGNGMQGTLLGIRGGIEGFSTLQMSVVMSAYFVGFLGGSRLAPEMIRRVGHIRVFAALGSLISATLILYPAITEPWAWMLLRVLIGFCFSGVYVTAESWLNDSATNETRGQALSLYMIVQMAGVVSAQYILVLGDPSGFILFIVPSVLVSISFAPILLSIGPTPPFARTKPMSLRQVFDFSPLSAVGMFLVGGVFSAMFGMTAVYGTLAGLEVAQISIFVSSFYVGGLLLQYPIGFVSDRMDRRILILLSAVGGGGAAVVAILAGSQFWALLAAGFVIGGFSNPLYALLLAYMNDYLEHEDMAAASGGLVFLNGMGAIAGPLICGYMMQVAGPPGFFLFIAGLMLTLAAYAVWRTLRRPTAAEAFDNVSYAPVWPTASPVAVTLAQEYYAGSAEEAAGGEADAKSREAAPSESGAAPGGAVFTAPESRT